CWQTRRVLSEGCLLSIVQPRRPAIRQLRMPRTWQRGDSFVVVLESTLKKAWRNGRRVRPGGRGRPPLHKNPPLHKHPPLHQTPPPHQNPASPQKTASPQKPEEFLLGTVAIFQSRRPAMLHPTTRG